MKDIQERVRKFCANYNLDAPAEHRALDVLSELGEVAKEILKATDYGKNAPSRSAEWKARWGICSSPLLPLQTSLILTLKARLTWL